MEGGGWRVEGGGVWVDVWGLRVECYGLKVYIPEDVCQVRKVDVRLPGKGNSKPHDARPVHLIITIIKWFRTSRLSIKNSLSVYTRRCLSGRGQ